MKSHFPGQVSRLNGSTLTFLHWDDLDLSVDAPQLDDEVLVPGNRGHVLQVTCVVTAQVPLQSLDLGFPRACSSKYVTLAMFDLRDLATPGLQWVGANKMDFGQPSNHQQPVNEKGCCLGCSGSIAATLVGKSNRASASNQSTHQKEHKQGALNPTLLNFCHLMKSLIRPALLQRVQRQDFMRMDFLEENRHSASQTPAPAWCPW